MTTRLDALDKIRANLALDIASLRGMWATPRPYNIAEALVDLELARDSVRHEMRELAREEAA